MNKRGKYMGSKSIIGLLWASFIVEAMVSAATAPVKAFDSGKMGGWKLC
jgi:hypothetical protein